MASIFAVSENTKKEVLKLFNKTFSDLNDDANLIKQWIKQCRHLPQNIDDERLYSFIVRNKFRLEQVKTKIDNYYTIRGLEKSITCWMDLNDNALVDNLKAFKSFPIKTLTNNYERLNIVKFYEGKFKLVVIMAVALMSLELALTYDFSASDIFIVDFEHFSIDYVSEFNVAKIMKFMEIHQKTMSGRFAGFYFINTPSFFNIVMKIFQLSFPEKIYKKIKIINSNEELIKLVGEDCLPSDYSGKQKSISELNDEWRQIINDNSKWLYEQSKIISNESLRVGSTPYSDLQGIDGSFKKLDID